MTMWLYLLLAVVGLAILGVVALVLRVADGNAPSEIESAHAQVLGVREIAVSGATQHWVAFRFSDGHQRELLATPSQADVIFRGQQGVVHFAGDRLTGWVPKLGGGVQDLHSSE
ncbi:MAG: hypothetical protein QM286_05590 [Acidobacteriota bacterium]|nr:hypothetical protein [Acidobacteriota bacterium]